MTAVGEKIPITYRVSWKIEFVYGSAKHNVYYLENYTYLGFNGLINNTTIIRNPKHQQ